MHRRVVKHVLRLGLLAAFVVLWASACGGGGNSGEKAEQEQPKARTIPESGKVLTPGKYTTEAFQPALSFTVGDGWQSFSEMHDRVMVGQTDAPAQLGFFSIERVFDPSNPKKIVPAPHDMAAWLQKHPGLATEELGRVTVGGVSSQQFEVRASKPTERLQYCTEPCIYLTAFSDGALFALGKSEICRFIVLDNVEGETVTIVVDSHAAYFEEFLPKAQRVLETVEWQGA
jgi:hypothetical protein